MAKRTADSKKYQKFRAEDQAGRAGSLTGFKKTESYGGTAAPRVGGTIKSTGMALGTSNKKQLKAAKRRVTQTAASPQAKRSAKKLY